MLYSMTITTVRIVATTKHRTRNDVHDSEPQPVWNFVHWMKNHRINGCVCVSVSSPLSSLLPVWLLLPMPNKCSPNQQKRDYRTTVWIIFYARSYGVSGVSLEPMISRFFSFHILSVSLSSTAHPLHTLDHINWMECPVCISRNGMYLESFSDHIKSSVTDWILLVMQVSFVTYAQFCTSFFFITRSHCRLYGFSILLLTSANGIHRAYSVCHSPCHFHLSCSVSISLNILEFTTCVARLSMSFSCHFSSNFKQSHFRLFGEND